MYSTAFLDHLQQHGVALCLHGHVHELTQDMVWWDRKALHVIGAGTFGLGHGRLPEATPGSTT